MEEKNGRKKRRMKAKVQSKKDTNGGKEKKIQK